MSSDSHFSLLVYYRVPASQCRAAFEAVREMQSAMATHWPGLQTRLMRRADAQSATEETWMETYEHPQGLSEPVVQMIDAHASALPVGVTGERHVEKFAPLAMPEA